VIQDGKLFECRTSLRIGAAEENIRKDYHFQDGSIKLNDEGRSTTFAEGTFAEGRSTPSTHQNR
jgi:hypothetical protein